MEKLINVFDVLEDGDDVAIIGHKNPDADAIASARILKYLIEQIHQDKRINFYLYFDGEISSKMKVVLDRQKINRKHDSKFKMVIAVDSASLEQLGKYKEIFESCEESVNIDHHATNTNFGKNVFVRDKCCTACILYAVMKVEKFEVSQDVCKLIYSAIVTDTACFTQNLTPQTYKYTEELARKKIDADAILKFFFKSNELSKLKLLSKALNTLKLYANDTFALMYLRYVDFARCKGEFGDTLGIVDNAINISKVKTAAIIIERQPKEFYVSLRSKGEIDVSEIATKFDGGGHKTMAAFNYTGDFKTLKRSLARACNSYIKKNACEEDTVLVKFRLPKYRKDK